MQKYRLESHLETIWCLEIPKYLVEDEYKVVTEFLESMNITNVVSKIQKGTYTITDIGRYSKVTHNNCSTFITKYKKAINICSL